MTIDVYEGHEEAFEQYRREGKPIATGGIVRISDHAMLRYLERACDFEIEAMREELAGILSAIVRPRSGRHSVVRDGLRFVFHGDMLTTVFENRPQETRPIRTRSRVRP